MENQGKSGEEHRDLSFEKRVQFAAVAILKSRHLVVFTGAGISTESGLPDYRGPDGVWTRRDKGLPPRKMKMRWRDVDPNQGHLALVELQEMGLLKFLISQNVDNLHLKSGIHPDRIAEFHGNSALMKCLECGQRFLKDEIWDENTWGKGYLTSPEIPGAPRCDCTGRIVSTVVNFGDPIPAEEYNRSTRHSGRADVFLVVGSSLQVTPASEMPFLALKNGGKLIIVNKMKTPLDHEAHLRFIEPAGQVLPAIIKKIKAAKRRADSR